MFIDAVLEKEEGEWMSIGVSFMSHTYPTCPLIVEEKTLIFDLFFFE